ncbi:MAG: hypothetical protein KBC21_03935 [Candidatus Pacebacteria bacterium]|nr:hypothetical protein [Candidatus Paceibacterota bacterium]
MSSSENVHTLRPFKMNGLWQFFPEMCPKEEGPDPVPLGPFRVLGDYKIERNEGGVLVQRFLILKPGEGCVFPVYGEYAVEYPEKLIATDFVTFETKGSAHRIRAQLCLPRKGVANLAILQLEGWQRPFREYVLYEKQVEGTWVPIEVDGEQLNP